MPPLPGGLTLCQVCAALPLRFRKKVSSPREKTLRLPRKSRPDAAAQSAAPATKHRHASCDTLLKYCACHAKRRRYVYACQETQQNHAICDKIDVRQMILSHFVSAAQRWGLATSSRLRTVADTKTTLSEPNSNLQTSRVKREPFATHSGKTPLSPPPTTTQQRPQHQTNIDMTTWPDHGDEMTATTARFQQGAFLRCALPWASLVFDSPFGQMYGRLSSPSSQFKCRTSFLHSWAVCRGTRWHSIEPTKEVWA